MAEDPKESFRQRYLSGGSLRERIHDLLAPTDGLLDYGVMTGLSALAYEIASSSKDFDSSIESVASMAYGAGVYAVVLGAVAYVRNTTPNVRSMEPERLYRGLKRTAFYTGLSIIFRSMRELGDVADKVSGIFQIVYGQFLRYASGPLILGLWSVASTAFGDDDEKTPSEPIPPKHPPAQPPDQGSAEIHKWIDSGGN